MAEKNLIKIYVNATSAKRVDIIIRHYTDFMGIVDGYTEGLRYMIECEKESSSRQDIGDLCSKYTICSINIVDKFRM